MVAVLEVTLSIARVAPSLFARVSHRVVNDGRTVRIAREVRGRSHVLTFRNFD